MQGRSWGRFFMGVGALVGASSLIHLFTDYWRAMTQAHFLLASILLIGTGLSVIYGGYWHNRNPFPASRYPRIIGWLTAGALLFTSVNVLNLFIGSNAVTPPELVEVVHVAGSIGVAVGLFVGTVEARAIRQTRTAASAEARANAMEAERERMDRINELLRHYVLNSLTVISGYRTRLGNDRSTGDQEEADVVEERIETIATLVEHVRTLSNGHGDATRSEQALEVLLASTGREVSGSRRVDIDVPDDIPMIAVTPSFERALYLLFEALDDLVDENDQFMITAHEVDDGVSISVSTERPMAFTEQAFAAAGPETKIKHAIVVEYVGESGRLSVGDDPDDSLACVLFLDAESVFRDEGVTAET
jgi:signal transduction histidine kinase